MEPLEPVLTLRLLSLRAIPALWLALQKTIGAVLFPGRKHLGQVIKAACVRRSLAASSFPKSAFILSLPVNSQTSHHGLFYTRASPERVLQPQNVLFRGLGCGQQCSPKLTITTGTFGAPMMVPGHCQLPGLMLEPSLEETSLFPQTALLQLSSFTFPNTLSQTKRHKPEGSAVQGIIPGEAHRCPESRTHLQQQLGPDTWSREKWEDMDPPKSLLWDPHTQSQ